ncbi:MAG: leucine-rich repeat domain-containing protein [Bacteroidales bacterium]
MNVFHRFNSIIPNDFHSLDIHIETPGTLDQYLVSTKCFTVKNLSVSGLIDKRDFATIKQQKYLRKIDLSRASIMPYNDNEKNRLPMDAFRGCKKITEILLPENLECISSQAFHKCYNIKKIEIPKTVKSIGYLAFNMCRNLEHIKFHENLKHIGFMCFLGCKKLNCIDLRTQDAIQFDFNTPIFEEANHRNCILKVKNGLAEKFSKAEQWCNFRHIEEINFE